MQTDDSALLEDTYAQFLRLIPDVPYVSELGMANALADLAQERLDQDVYKNLQDQHAYLRIDPADDLKIGDMLAFDICHPCLTFDKWRVLPILDAGYNVIDIAQTFF